MKTTISILTCLLLAIAAAPALADSGPIQDPTGCATGSAVANCRSVPALGRDSGSSSFGNSNRNDRKQRQFMKSSPLPSAKLRREPPASTGLDKGSTGISNDPLYIKKRIGH